MARYKPDKKNGPNVLIWDIETLPGEFYGWGLFDPPFEQIKPKTIACISYKWAGELDVHRVHLSKSQLKKDPRFDKDLIEDFLKVYENVDILVAHNGDKYDSKVLAARAIINGFPPLPAKSSIDTLKLARRHFGFDSNRLNEIGKALHLGEKLHTPKGTAISVLQGDYDALVNLMDYCDQDVLLLEAIYEKMRPYCKLPVTFDFMGLCINCGSDDLRKDGIAYSPNGTKQRYYCPDCGCRRMHGPLEVLTKKSLKGS
jgi:DNA polymerase elongation subunit (family B)